MEGGESCGAKRGAAGVLQQMGEPRISENHFLLERIMKMTGNSIIQGLIPLGLPLFAEACRQRPPLRHMILQTLRLSL